MKNIMTYIFDLFHKTNEPTVGHLVALNKTILI